MATSLDNEKFEKSGIQDNGTTLYFQKMGFMLSVTDTIFLQYFLIFSALYTKLQLKKPKLQK